MYITFLNSSFNNIDLDVLYTSYLLSFIVVHVDVFMSIPFTNCVLLAGLPKMLVIRSYFGVPSPSSGPALSIQTGDIIELICADLHCPWWQVRVHTLF